MYHARLLALKPSMNCKLLDIISSSDAFSAIQRDTLASNSADSIQQEARLHSYFVRHPTQSCISAPHGAFLCFRSSSHFFSLFVSIFPPARCSCSRAPAHNPDHPHEEGDPRESEPPFPFRHFLFAFCFSMYLAILLSGARQKFFKSSSSLFAPSSSSLSPVPPQ